MEISQIRKPEELFDSVVLLFPSDDAKDICLMSKEELLAIKKVVLIDCTWNQTKHFLK
jgi:DTW domain-containing protein YfiP